jgi:hypothetical protein
VKKNAQNVAAKPIYCQYYQGCQIFCPNIPKRGKTPNGHKLYQTVINCAKLIIQNVPNDHKIYKHFPFKGHPKYTRIGMFGIEINNLASLIILLYRFYREKSCPKFGLLLSFKKTRPEQTIAQ